MPSNRGGFTLVELMVVIGLLTVLLSITLAALNPARQFQKANNIERQSNLKAISDAVYQHIGENGSFPAQIDSNLRVIGTNTTGCDIVCGTTGGSSPTTVNLQVSAGSDDAEEREPGKVILNDADLDLVRSLYTTRVVGLRFQGVSIPAGAVITSATLELVANGTSSETTNLIIKGEKATNSSVFAYTQYNISGRAQTTAQSAWNNVPSVILNDVLLSPNISTVVQEVVDQGGWSSGNPLTLIISGTGRREVKSYNGSALEAPKLNVTYDYNSQTYNSIFQISAGIDDAEQSVTREVSLTGTDLELVEDSATPQEVGIRFTNVTVPKDAVINSATLEFVIESQRSTTTNLQIYGEDADNSATFDNAQITNISSRTKTGSSVAWTSVPSPTVGQSLTAPDVSSIVSEITSRSGWISGNPLTIIITGSGRRNVESYEGSSSDAPTLSINYSSSSSEYAESTCIDLSSELVPLYLSELPIDPVLGSGGNSYYGIQKLGNNRIKVVSCSDESDYMDVIR